MKKLNEKRKHLKDLDSSKFLSFAPATSEANFITLPNSINGSIHAVCEFPFNFNINLPIKVKIFYSFDDNTDGSAVINGSFYVVNNDYFTTGFEILKTNNDNKLKTASFYFKDLNTNSCITDKTKKTYLVIKLSRDVENYYDTFDGNISIFGAKIYQETIDNPQIVFPVNDIIINDFFLRACEPDLIDCESFFTHSE